MPLAFLIVAGGNDANPPLQLEVADRKTVKRIAIQYFIKFFLKLILKTVLMSETKEKMVRRLIWAPIPISQSRILWLWFTTLLIEDKKRGMLHMNDLVWYQFRCIRSPWKKLSAKNPVFRGGMVSKSAILMLANAVGIFFPAQSTLLTTFHSSYVHHPIDFPKSFDHERTTLCDLLIFFCAWSNTMAWFDMSR